MDKEVIANALHYSSDRRKGPLVKGNCGAIPDNLLDSELFGHEKGAFTGALEQKRGRFERADKGTIFLDEIGELPLAAQVRLLHVIQNKEIERAGGSKAIPVDVRIVCATHRDLGAMVAKGDFREGLWFRFNVFPVTIPPLRHRKADIPALVEHFIERKNREMKLKYRPVPSSLALEHLQRHNWPGNVRELGNTVERELIRTYAMAPGAPLHFDEFASQPAQILLHYKEQAAGLPPSRLDLDSLVADHIRRVLDMTAGKAQGEDGAAAILGVNPSTLRHRMRKLGIVFGRKA